MALTSPSVTPCPTAHGARRPISAQPEAFNHCLICAARVPASSSSPAGEGTLSPALPPAAPLWTPCFRACCVWGCWGTVLWAPGAAHHAQTQWDGAPLLRGTGPPREQMGLCRTSLHYSSLNQQIILPFQIADKYQYLIKEFFLSFTDIGLVIKIGSSYSALDLYKKAQRRQSLLILNLIIWETVPAVVCGNLITLVPVILGVYVTPRLFRRKDS